MMAAVCVVARLLMEYWVQSHCRSVETSSLPTSILVVESETPGAEADEEDVESCMAQYLPLSALVHAACLKGVNA